MSTIQAIQKQADIWKVLNELPDDAVLDCKLAAFFLGISTQTLTRLRGQETLLPYIQYHSKAAKARNQKVNYILRDLRNWRESQKVSSTIEAAKIRGLT